MDALVSKVHAREKRWHAEFILLRKLCLATGLHEGLKWGKACYDLEGRNVVLIQGFKEYCALLFVKGAAMKDSSDLFIRQTRNVQAARQLRFASLAAIRASRAAITLYLEEAIQVEKAGVKIAYKDVAEFPVAAEFRAAMESQPGLARAFAALTPGRRKAYLLHFAGAKQSATRTARVQRHASRILRGLGMDD